MDATKMTRLDTIARWYLIQTKPRQELRAEENLRRQQFECWRPLRAVHTTGSGRSPRAEEPLFPGYLFIRLDQVQDNWYPIRSTRGVSRIVGFGNGPTPVRDELVQALRQRLASEQPGPTRLQHGDRVRIEHESLSEIEAIFVSADGNDRSVILLKLLEREQKVSIANHLLRCV